MCFVLFSCKKDVLRPLRGGTCITIKGDTITFYGGVLHFNTFKSIRDM